MIPDDFSKALLRSASSDAPSAATKASALAAAERAVHVSAGAAGVSAGAVATKAAIGSKLAVVVVASALVAGGAGVGGGFVWGRASAPSKVVHDENTDISARSAIAEPNATSPTSPAPSAQPAAAASSEAPVQADVCESRTATESNVCSTKGGHTVTFAIKSSCTKDVLDIFWVDESCREVFKGFVHPGEIYWQDSWDSHVFRLRDHATHRLVKEITAPVVDGAPDRDKYWKGPPTELPLVSIKESDLPITETAPPECAHGGGRAAMLHIRNERKTTPITIMAVDPSCNERELKQIGPGDKFDGHTSEGHAFRIRDVSGALLADIPPTSLDTATYLTVP